MIHIHTYKSYTEYKNNTVKPHIPIDINTVVYFKTLLPEGVLTNLDIEYPKSSFLWGYLNTNGDWNLYILNAEQER